MIAHPSYHRNGTSRCSTNLRELEKHPDHWFSALHKITGADPVVPKDAQGNLLKMADAWLNWGRENGYNWQSESD